ncbi:MAG: PAS domain S-box protein [Rhodoferax sp.]|nr:MAG: PAS domain S-box protein [Rhodoferax sp.]
MHNARMRAVSQWKSLFRQTLVPVAVLLLGLAISLMGGVWMHQKLSEAAQKDFDIATQRVANEIQRRYEASTATLFGARGFFNASGYVSRTEFATYAQSRSAQGDVPGVRGLGYLEKVERARSEQFITSEHARGAPWFEIRTIVSSSMDPLYVVKYLEPAGPFHPALGVDFGSERLRRETIERALETGGVTLSPALSIANDTVAQQYLMLPVYKGSLEQASDSIRHQQAYGAVFVPLVPSALLADLPDVNAGMVNVHVFDTTGGVSTLLYDNEMSTPELEFSPLSLTPRDFTASRELSIGGRTLLVSVDSTPAFESNVARITPLLMVLAGATLSLLLALLIRTQAVSLERAQRKAQAMTRDLNRLAEVVKHTSNAVSISNEHGRIQWVNEGFTRITGYTLNDAFSKTPGELLGNEKADPQAVSALLHAMQKGQACRVEVLNRTKSGKEFWVDTEIQPLYDSMGVLEGYMEIASDISESKAAAQELARQRQELANIIDATNVGTWSWDVPTNRVTINARWAQILGYTPGELTPVTLEKFNQLVHPDDLEKVNAQLAHHLHGHSTHFACEMRMRHKDGHWVWIADHGKVVSFDKDGHPRTVAGTHSDISERRKMEESAQRSAALLRGAIDVIDEAFALYGPDDRLVLCNEKYRQVYAKCAPAIVEGARFEDIIRYGAERGEYLDAVGRVDDWVRERVAVHRASNSTLIQRLDNGRTMRIIERRLPDGHIVGFRIDITDLTLAQEQAEAASQAKSQFLANMSHEIRTPMNAILGMLTLLGKTPLNEKQADYADKAQNAARTLLHLLNDILDLSKVEAGKMTLDPQPFSVQQLLRDLSVIMTANVGSKPVKLRWKVDPNVPPHMVGDVLRLQQVLVNLGGNAVKFTAEGEVTVSLQLVKRSGDLATVRFSVRDTGIGIAPENQARIFAGFTQAEASTTRRFGGTGLGVSISHKLVALMGGELALHSEPGQGSDFFFQLTLPISASQFVARTLSKKHLDRMPAGPRLQGLRILLTEDNITNQQIATELLRDEGALVQVANNGQEAVEALRTGPDAFDAVLMDLQMPIMDGLTATRVIRGELGQTFLPIIAMTANAMRSDREACLQAGMNDHIGKPFDLDQLIEVLRIQTGRESENPPPLPKSEKPTGRAPLLPTTAMEFAHAAHIELETALARMGNKIGLYVSMLRTFLSDMTGMAPALEQHVQNQDAMAAQRLLHTLKGLAATLGLTTLSHQAAQTEKQLKNAPADAQVLTPTLIQSVVQTLEVGRQNVHTLLALLEEEKKPTDTATVQPPSADLATVRATLQAMASQLRASDMQALETMAQLQSQWPAEHQDQIGTLQQAVASLDFDAAKKACDAMSNLLKKPF